MSKLASMARNALKTRVSPLNPTRNPPSFRRFSTEEGGESQQQQHDSSSSAATDPFLQSPEGAVFGRVTVASKNLLKTDIIHFFEGCNLSGADVKVNRSQWELLSSYDGKSVLFRGIPRNAFPEDIERFLAGSN